MPIRLLSRCQLVIKTVPSSQAKLRAAKVIPAISDDGANEVEHEIIVAANDADSSAKYARVVAVAETARSTGLCQVGPAYVYQLVAREK